MNLAIGQPRYLPSLHYLHRMVLADLFVYLDCVQYTPRDWENRVRVGKVGKVGDDWQWLTVPVLHTAREQLVKDTLIDRSSKWKRKHLGTLRRAYARAAHFEPYYSEYEEILERGHETLMALNRDLTDWLLASFGLSGRFEAASALEPSGTGDDRLVVLCERAGADIYISGAGRAERSGGRGTIAPQRFRAAGISFYFHDYDHPEYDQGGDGFVPHMSAIDLLFCEGEAGGAILQSGNVDRKTIERTVLEEA